MEEHIDGVIAGFSEFTVDSMIALCDRLGLPCYIRKEQLEVTRDKAKFKALCSRFDVPTVPAFPVDSEHLPFPVIIKPTDRAGSIGISVARNEDEYKSGLAKALDASVSKQVVIEKYMGDSLKFDCYYEIIEGQPVLVGTSDTIMLSSEKGHETMQKAWSYPSSAENRYKMTIAYKVENMIRSLNFSFGYCTISFFYDGSQFYAFETGFRLSGEHSYDYQRLTQGNDYMDDMIDFALGLPLKPRKQENRRMKMLTYNLYIAGGERLMVNSAESLKDIKGLPNIVSVVPYVYDGYSTETSAPLKIAMCSIQGATASEIWQTVQLINATFAVETNQGTKRVFNPLSQEEVNSCWKNN